MNTAGRVTLSGVILGGIVAIGLGTWRILAGPDRAIKNIEPDAPPQPTLGKTGYKRIDAILPKLRAASQSSGIPLGLMVGWIAKESGGKLSDKPQPGPADTSMGERGFFQMTPEESKTLGLDHERLSSDPDYSIDSGVKLIRHYQSAASDLNLPAAPAGSVFAWLLTKLGHSMGGGQMKKVVAAAKVAGQAGSWNQLMDFALDMHINGPQPKKWFPFIDDTREPTKANSVYRIGRPFGFGNESSATVGAVLSADGEMCGFDALGAEFV